MNHISQHPGISKADPNYRPVKATHYCIDCGGEYPVEYVEEYHSPKLGTYHVCRECQESE